MENKETEEGRIYSVVAYLTIIGSIISIIMNQNKKNNFVAFHCRQGLGLCLSYMLIGYFFFIAGGGHVDPEVVVTEISFFQSDMVYFPFWIFFGILFLYGIIGAATGKKNIAPIIGPLFQKLFKGLGN
ncbi:hypothetical protein [Psychroserpens sp. NJDZ02]|uniref:hypothetical protein n=1 Tax=Psychroserpens sp. NJDZ02 TaxID=2570561 RepID=UPI0010A9084E|nr:hypothetical protein [Psychroserpens sp. NJDZ02]QCE43205.1 hypothetical protein E9099_17865 [Psychroserpens sp. NJDZ02]